MAGNSCPELAPVAAKSMRSGSQPAPPALLDDGVAGSVQGPGLALNIHGMVQLAQLRGGPAQVAGACVGWIGLATACASALLQGDPVPALHGRHGTVLAAACPAPFLSPWAPTRRSPSPGHTPLAAQSSSAAGKVGEEAGRKVSSLVCTVALGARRRRRDYPPPVPAAGWLLAPHARPSGGVCMAPTALCSDLLNVPSLPLCHPLSNFPAMLGDKSHHLLPLSATAGSTRTAP